MRAHVEPQAAGGEHRGGGNGRPAQLHRDAREQLAQWLLAYDNVRLFDFAAREEWTLDLDRYMDYSHHDPQMNEQIVRGMAAGENAVRDVAQVLAANEAIRAAAESFERPY